MAKPIAFKPVTVDFKADLQRRLEKASEEHAAALLAAYDVLEAAYDEGLLDILHGMIASKDTIITTLSHYANQPEGIAGIRNLLTAAKILTELDPEALEHISKAMAGAAEEYKREEKPPSLFQLARRANHEDSRRGLSFLTLLLVGSWQVAEELGSTMPAFSSGYGQITDVTNPFDVGKAPHQVSIGRGKLFLIAGPCVIESERHARMMADAIQRIASDLGIPYIFKASYDKANRTSIKSFRGPGLVEGCRILRAIGESTGLPVLTDVHTAADCGPVAESGRCAADSGVPLPSDRSADRRGRGDGQDGRRGQCKEGPVRRAMGHAARGREDSGERQPRVSLTERGASFGYNNLVVDMRSLAGHAGLCPSGLRRHTFGADAVGRQRRQRRPAGVHSCADPRGGGRRS